MGADPPRDEAGVRAWIRGQGFWLEHETFAALEKAGFHASLGRVYLDPITEKLRDVDVVGAAVPDVHIKLRAVFECKAGNSGAWVVRRARIQHAEHLAPSPIATDRAASFLRESRIFPRAFPIVQPMGFAAHVTGNAQIAHAVLQQAVSSTQGVIGQTSGSAFGYPVVVIGAPLFGLSYDDAGGDVLDAIPGARLLFGGADRIGGLTLVDIVRREALHEYLPDLLESLERLSAYMDLEGWQKDQ